MTHHFKSKYRDKGMLCCRTKALFVAIHRGKGKISSLVHTDNNNYFANKPYVLHQGINKNPACVDIVCAANQQSYR